MNIEDHFNNADAYLEMSKEKFTAQDYDSSLSSLGKAYSHIRELMLKIYQVKRNAALSQRPAGEDVT